jgi:hypothetical protein
VTVELGVVKVASKERSGFSAQRPRYKTVLKLLSEDS